MNKQWFVLHTLTGQEKSVMDSINRRIQIEMVEEYIGKCVIPTERITEKKNGRRHTYTRKLFPGYVLCEMALYDEAKGLDDDGKKVFFERTWQFIRNTPGVIGFVGVDARDPRACPQPLTQGEVDAIFATGERAVNSEPRPRISFAVNETVKINEGAFMGLTGLVSVVDPDKSKLKVEVQVFGRKVPVDVEYYQVEKVAIEETLDAKS